MAGVEGAKGLGRCLLHTRGKDHGERLVLYPQEGLPGMLLLLRTLQQVGPEGWGLACRVGAGPECPPVLWHSPL